MAGRDTNLNINVTATDKASPTLTRIEKKVDGLESDEARIVVTAETERLESKLAAAKQKLDGLDGDEATVQARLIGTLESDLDSARQLFNQLDGKTGTVHINAVDTASGDIDKVSDQLRRLDGDSATVHVGTVDGAALGAGVAGGAAALAAGLGVAAQNAADTAIQVQAIANRSGASLESVSRLVAVFKDNGTEASDLADILYNVNGVLRDNPELAKQLGVEMGEGTNMVTQFLGVVEGLETKFDDVGAAGVAASQLLGEEGVRQVDVVTASVGDLQTAVENVPQARIYSADDVQAGRDINTQLAATQGYIEAIAIQMLPIINGLLKFAANWFPNAAKAGAAVAEAGGDTRRAVAGYVGSVFSADAGGDVNNLPSYINSGAGRTNVTIINPAGTPAATVNGARIYQRRNGEQ